MYRRVIVEQYAYEMCEDTRFLVFGEAVKLDAEL